MLPQVYKTDINLVNVYCLDIQHLRYGIHACILYEGFNIEVHLTFSTYHVIANIIVCPKYTALHNKYDI